MVATGRPSWSLAWATWTSRWVSTPMVSWGAAGCAMLVMAVSFPWPGGGRHARRPGGQHCEESGRQAHIRSHPSGWRAGGGRGPGRQVNPKAPGPMTARDHRSGISTCRGIRPSGPPTRTPPTTAWAPGQPSQRPHRATNPRPLPHSPTLAPSQAWSAGPRLGRPATNCRTAASAARADGIVSSSSVGRPAVPTWSSWRTISSPKRLAAARGRQQWTGPAGRSKLDTGMMQQNGGAAETWTAWATAITAVARW